ncbi:carbohydrate binding family 9 domain-containing protein [candidate division KSB1 bacterium]|nr:carbohydrate binding family 9 domain-containing protein [candidate division KSB1 bacterium]MBL7094808.1 carbohydrate binding family 9 domain-containing protein [candidate division KSB1 bacterium]
MNIQNKTLIQLQTFILLLAIGNFTAIAQNQYIVPRLSEKIEFDGLCDDTVWQNIEPLPIIMHQPTFGLEPTEKTEVLIAYDDDYFYVAGRLYDKEPSKIQSTSKKRDFLGGNADWFGLILDTFNDKENAVSFFTTPAGLRLDTSVFGDAEGEMPINPSWNTFWDVKTVTNEKGWFVEMRIPFSSLRFQEIDGKVVMGFTAWRWIPHKNESSVYPAIPPKWGGWSTWKPSKAQEIVFKDIHSKKPVYIAPYILGGFGKNFELNEDETAYLRTDDPAHEIGLDVKYGLTNNLTMDVTLNTDFAQVEADDQQVNLTRFSLFFPEKRLFFQERSSNFEFNLGGLNRLFYSRRIGIYDGQPVRIYGGARIVGRVGPWDVGMLNMQTAPIEELKTENFGVCRLRRQVFNQNSYVGGIVTSRIGAGGTYNLAYGLDGIFRVLKDDYIIFNWAQTFEDSSENKNQASLDLSRISFGWERRTKQGLGYYYNFSRTGRIFNPGIGFLNRNDYTRFGSKVLYGWIPGEKSWLQRHYLYLDGFTYLRNSDSGVESVQIGPGWFFSAKSVFEGNFSANMYYEDVPDTFSLSDDVEVPVGRYTFFGIKSYYMTPMTSFYYAILKLETGSFYDGWRFSLSAMPGWSISSDFELSGFYQFNRVSFPDRNQHFTAHISRIKALWMMSTSLSLSAFVQYNSAADAFITNVRFRYNPREGNDLYLVYDEGMNTNRFRETPFLPTYSNRTILLKYTYTFNL